MRLRVRTLGPLAVFLAGVLPAAADPIHITSGAFVWPAPGGNISVTLNGDGFSFNGTTTPTDAFLRPREDCSVPECFAGSTVRLLTTASGVTYRNATATYGGEEFDHVGGLGSLDAGISTTWDGSFSIPAGFTGGFLTAPFSFSGLFIHPTGGQFNTVDLVGAGTATISLTPYGDGTIFPGAFRVAGLRFDFEPAATPEPASLLLLGTGLAGLAAARRRRA